MQLIFVYIIIAVAVGLTAFSFFKKSQNKKIDPCEGCTGCDLKRDLTCNLKD